MDQLINKNNIAGNIDTYQLHIMTVLYQMFANERKKALLITYVNSIDKLL